MSEGIGARDPAVPPRAAADPMLRALETLVFAPIGFALRAPSLIPELVEQGRAKAVEQVRMARAIGRFVVPIARRKGEAMLRERARDLTSDRRGRSAHNDPAAAPEPGAADTERASDTAVDAVRRRPAPRRASGASKALPAPDVSRSKPRVRAEGSKAERTTPSLAIDAYDALPASSIVDLLVGLRPAQLRAIDRYERAGRGRRTVLARIDQLLAASER